VDNFLIEVLLPLFTSQPRACTLVLSFRKPLVMPSAKYSLDRRPPLQPSYCVAFYPEPPNKITFTWSGMQGSQGKSALSSFSIIAFLRPFNLPLCEFLFRPNKKNLTCYPHAILLQARSPSISPPKFMFSLHGNKLHIFYFRLHVF